MKILNFFVLLFLFAFKTSTGVFDLSIIMPDGNDQSLNPYHGKKMMIVILPATHTPENSALLQLIGTLNNNYSDSITLIGVPSYEDGFTEDSISSLMSWYRSYLDSRFVITGGMNIRKISPYQTPLFSFLTHAEQNGYFDEDVIGIGEKFFINEEGDLYGISTPDADFSEEIFKQMIRISTGH
jgi:glutathione peroxidase